MTAWTLVPPAAKVELRNAQLLAIAGGGLLQALNVYAAVQTFGLPVTLCLGGLGGLLAVLSHITSRRNAPCFSGE